MKKSPLKAKQSLRARKPLKQAVSLKRTKSKSKRLTLEQKSAQQLVKVADKYFSQYIRLRDSQKLPDGKWVGICITCPRQMVVYTEDRWIPGAQNGHYVGRANHELRYDEEDCNLQCAWCNAWRDKVSMLNAYKEALDLKYGDGTAAKLESMPVRYSSKKAELLAVIADSKAQVEWYLTNQ